MMTFNFSWKLLNPANSLTLWLADNYNLQLRPEPDFSGSLPLSISPVAKNWDGNLDFGRNLEILLEVTKPITTLLP